MKRNLFGGLAVASALTLWTSVAGFADTLGDATTFAGTATAAVNKCQTDILAKLDGIATASTNAEATQEAKDAIAEAKDEVTDIAKDASLDIAGALADFKEALDENDEDEPAPSLDAFKSLVTGLRDAACSKMDNVFTATQAEVKEILADIEDQPAAENEQKDHHMDAATQDKSEREHENEQERD